MKFMMVRRIIDMIDRTNLIVGKLCYPLILVLSMVVLFEIVTRTFFRATLWAYETTQFIFVVCSLLAGGHLLKTNEHISVDILYARFSRKTQIILDIITFPFFLLFAGAMFYFGLSFAYDSFMVRETTGSVWDPYIFPLKMLIPFAALLILLQGIANIFKAIESTFAGQKPRDTELPKFPPDLPMEK